MVIKPPSLRRGSIPDRMLNSASIRYGLYMNWTDIVGLATSIVTAIGVIVAARQLTLSKRQTRTQFEDDLAREYRALVERIPVKALFGEVLDQTEYEENLHLFYRYIDLSNEQVFLRQKERLSSDTWENWVEGIKANLSLPAFAMAWGEIKSKLPHRFQELRLLEKRDFKGDPKDWCESVPELSGSPSKNYLESKAPLS
jgi:hypothetical protein